MTTPTRRPPDRGRRHGAPVLGTFIAARLGIIVVLVLIWRPWATPGSPFTWILGVLVMAVLVVQVRWIWRDGRALAGLLGGRGPTRESDAADLGS